MRRFATFLLLTACGTPVSGTLPEGIYGSPDIGLRVDATGNAVFEKSCHRGDLGVVSVVDGAIDASFEWERTGGDPPDSAEPGIPATLEATATDMAIVGTITSEGEGTDVNLHFGQEPTYFECP